MIIMNQTLILILPPTMTQIALWSFDRAVYPLGDVINLYGSETDNTISVQYLCIDDLRTETQGFIMVIQYQEMYNLPSNNGNHPPYRIYLYHSCTMQIPRTAQQEWQGY